MNRLINLSIEVVSSESRVMLELDLPSKDGQVISCEFTLTGLKDAEGEMQGLLFVGHDMSMRKSLEESAVETAALMSRVDAPRKRQNEDEIIPGCVDYLLNCNSLAESHQIVFRHLADLYSHGSVRVCTGRNCIVVAEPV